MQKFIQINGFYISTVDIVSLAWEETILSINCPVIINENLLLFGSDTLSAEQNKHIFSCTEKSSQK